MSKKSQSLSFSGEGKNIVIAYGLWFFLGGFGIHRFYLGKVGTGLVQLGLLAFGFATSFILIGLIPLLVLAVWWVLDAYFVYKYVEEANRAAPGGHSTLSVVTVEKREDDLDQLQKLHDLHKSGALTKAEYQSRKKKLLGEE